MSIEIRNFYPSSDSANISIYSDIYFDLVALDDYGIDITSLSVVITTTSNIDSETHDVSYVYGDNEISYFSHSNVHYHINVNPSLPFDEGQTVTISINVEGTDENDDLVLMEEYTSQFRTYYNGVMSDFRYAFIDACERIPVYNETLRSDSTTSPKVFDSAFHRWNRDKFLKITINQVIVKPDDTTYPYTIDYQDGKIIFDNPLDYNDVVQASYTFAFFSDEQIDSFFKQAAAQWRMFPPYGGPANIYSASFATRAPIMVGASLFAFRELLFQLSLQEVRIIFDSASWNDGWTQVKDLFKMLLDSYEKDWEALKEAKKAKLPYIAAISTPAFTLPGGRSRMFRYLFNG